MKKLVHKNQIIITALAVMIVVAGYLNFTGQEITTSNLLQGNTEQTKSEKDAKADKGDDKKKKDDSKKAKEDGEEAEETMTKDISEEDSAQVTVNDKGEVVASQENPGEAVMVSNTIGADYFSSAKLSREQTRAKNKETLMEIINNKNVASADKKSAVKEVAEITQMAEKENATEMMLTAKGFQEAMVSISDGNADVVVNAEELTSKQMAQILDIVKRKTGLAAENIVITPVQVEKK
ncbi:MAG: SpoIIIAH-like family protein [Lachnospiraceae bacterium]|nr:SpoIIIAH-like family protein [Lachnospiraceae bacterium]